MAQSVEYAAKRMISQSALKVLEQDPRKFYWEEERFLTGELIERPGRGKSEYMLMGDITETLLFDFDNFSKQYKIIKDAPTGQMLDFVKEYYKLKVQSKIDGYLELDKDGVMIIAKKAYEIAGFKRDKFETVLERFKTEGLGYYNLLKSGKTLVSIEMYDKAFSITEALKADEFIGPIVTAKTERMVEVFDQLEIYSNFLGDEVKGALDRAIINHLDQRIYPYDFKTTSDYFSNSFVSYRYDMQAAFYIDLLRNWIKDNEKRLEYYSIAPFNFIVASTTSNRNELWEISEEDLNVGRSGGINTYGREVKGYNKLLVDYKWHKENNKWKYPREVYENNGRRVTNCYKEK